MFRKLVSISLLVSLIAVGGSGIMMIVLGSFEFQMQMHPVHKIFGIIMCVSGLCHVFLNFKPIQRYLKNNKVAVFAGVLLAFLALLFAAGMKKPIDKEVIAEIEAKMSELSHK